MGRFPPGDCVELFYGADRVSQTTVTSGGSFAIQFFVLGDGNSPFTLQVSSEERGTRESVLIPFEHITQAEIAYPPNTTPLIAEADGTLAFSGSLEPGAGSRIEDAWMVNWTTGAVSVVLPAPLLSSGFSATVAGRRTHCATIMSSHADGVGGCWWPIGGGGCAPFCTEEEYRAGGCLVERIAPDPCFGRRGCEVLEATERRSGTPPPETTRSIPVLPPPPDPIDTGIRPDAPMPLEDGGVM